MLPLKLNISEELWEIFGVGLYHVLSELWVLDHSLVTGRIGEGGRRREGGRTNNVISVGRGCH